MSATSLLRRLVEIYEGPDDTMPLLMNLVDEAKQLLATPPTKDVKKGSVTVTVSMLSGGTEAVRLTIRDEASRACFLELSLNPTTFTTMLLGRVATDVPATFTNVQSVGRERILEPRTIQIPWRLSREDAEGWLRDNAQEKGWYVDPYLGSQNSLTTNDDVMVARYYVYRYTDD